MRTFAIVVETKGNPAVSKKKPSEDNGVLEQPVNGATAEAEDEALPDGELDEGSEELEGDEESSDFPLDGEEDDAEATAEFDAEGAEGEPVAEDAEVAEGDEDLPLDEMAAEEQDETLPEDGMEDGLEADPAEVAHDWAGDEVVDDRDVTDPAAAFRSFTGPTGETAWLDRADDGTLTGWVQAADGTVFRYADADAWAIDVDDAQMTVAGDEPLEDEMVEEEPVEDDELLADEGEPIDPVDPSAAPLQGKTLLGVRRLA